MMFAPLGAERCSEKRHDGDQPGAAVVNNRFPALP